jgi:hypothetical protein
VITLPKRLCHRNIDKGGGTLIGTWRWLLLRCRTRLTDLLQAFDCSLGEHSVSYNKVALQPAHSRIVEMEGLGNSGRCGGDRWQRIKPVISDATINRERRCGSASSSLGRSASRIL